MAATGRVSALRWQTVPPLARRIRRRSLLTHCGRLLGACDAPAPDDLRSYPSADDGLPHRWDCETAGVLYWERYRRRDSAGPEAPAIPTIAGKSLQIPNIRTLHLFC